MTTYLSHQTVGQNLQNTVSIFFKHLGAIAVPYIVVLAPLNIVQSVALVNENTGLYVFTLLVSIPVSLLIYGILVVSISELCLGSRPSIFRSLKHVVGGVAGSLVLASLLQPLIVIGGYVLLIIPGILFTLWFMFTPLAVVLEHKKPIEALKRSKALSKGSRWRIFGLLVLWTLLGMVLGGITGGVMAAFGGELAYQIALVLVTLCVQCLLLISMVLMYYDLRVRNEGYNTAGLAEDLAR